MADEHLHIVHSISLPTLQVDPSQVPDRTGETLSPSSQLQSSAASTNLDRPILTTANLSTLSASARTSYTRVDLSNMDVGVPPRANDGIQDRDSNQILDEDMDAQDRQGVEPTVPDMPQVSLTFLLVSGRRRPMSFDQEMTIGRVKELVWNAWPNEWQDERPPAPSYLRILYLGKILQDDDTLTKVGFTSYTPSTSIPLNGSAQGASRPSTPPPSTIVHLSIRAYAPPAQDAPKKKGRRQRRSQTTGGGDGPQEVDEMEGGAGCCGGCTIS